MDVLSLDITRAAPFRGAPGERSPLARLRLRWRGILDRTRPSDPGDPERPVGEAAGWSRQALLHGWTAGVILLGLGLLALVTAVVPFLPRIADAHLNGTALAGTTGGVLLWTVFGLLGSMRSLTSLDRQFHFTFHLPFVGAAMVLGGPAAGAWVAVLSTIERRELASLPWYGILANHATIVTAAVLGGATVMLTDGFLAASTGDAQLARFASIILGGLVLELLATVLASLTYMIRDGMSRSAVLTLVIEDFGVVTLIEIGLIWVLTVAFLSVGWWAPLIVGALVLVLISRDSDPGVDPITELPGPAGWERAFERKLGWMRRGILDGGTLMILDLNGLAQVNLQHGLAVGDDVLRVVAGRLREACPRRDDVVARIGGDEFALFFAGLVSREVAQGKADRIVESICRPVPTSVGAVHITVAIGVQVVLASGGVPSSSTLVRRAEQAMQIAKDDGSACGAAHQHAGDDPDPFDGRWEGSGA